MAPFIKMRKTHRGRNGFGQGNWELALDKLSLRIPLLIPIGGVRYTVGCGFVALGRSQLFRALNMISKAK